MKSSITDLLLQLKQKMETTTTTRASTTEDKSISDEKRDFMAVFPGLVRNVIEHVEKLKCYDAAKWFERVLQYNIPHGKSNRGLRIVLTYKALVSKEQLTPENILLVQYLGWCVEMLQSFYLITDDIMDNSSTRRGQPCWHKVEDVGLIAINDAALIESAIYAILKQHFSHLDCYVDLMELFHEITFITNCGQAMDMLISRNTITEFTMETYKTIAANKTAYYTFCLPFALALHFAGIKHGEVFQQSKSILRDIGILFQIQDDMIDCFGDPEVSGKIGTDIEDGKCTWLAAECIQRANAAQKAIMVECYGHNDPAKVERVKKLYNDLDLPTIYNSFKEESYKNITKQIEQIPDNVPRSIILDIFDSIYHRDA